MKVIFYAVNGNGTGKQVQRLVEDRVPWEGLEFFRTAEDLSHRLRYRSHDVEAAVLVPADTEDLKALTAMGDMLSDTRVILILPDSKRLTIALGRSLYPRFVGYADSNFVDITAVFNKIFGNPSNP